MVGATRFSRSYLYKGGDHFQKVPGEFERYRGGGPRPFHGGMRKPQVALLRARSSGVSVAYH